MVQVSALLVDAFQARQFSGRSPSARNAQPCDDFQGIRPEAGTHQMIESECCPLHRQPAILHHHRKRRVHQQRHRRLGARLGLGNFDVVDGSSERNDAAACCSAGPSESRSPLTAAPHWSACGRCSTARCHRIARVGSRRSTRRQPRRADDHARRDDRRAVVPHRVTPSPRAGAWLWGTAATGRRNRGPGNPD